MTNQRLELAGRLEGLVERRFRDEGPHRGAAGWGLIPTPVGGDPADEVEAAAVRLVVVGMAEDYRTHPAFIVNFEADPAARTAEVCLNITRAVDYGVGDHLAERQLGVRSAQPPGRQHPAGPVSGHRHGRHRGGKYPGASSAVTDHTSSLPVSLLPTRRLGMVRQPPAAARPEISSRAVGRSRMTTHLQVGSLSLEAASVEELDFLAAGAGGEAGGLDPITDGLVNIAPVLEYSLQDVVAVDRGGVPGDVVDQPVPAGIIEHPVDQGVGLAVVVVGGMPGVGRPDHVAIGGPHGVLGIGVLSAAGAPSTEFG